jgi:hypothetical protein
LHVRDINTKSLPNKMVEQVERMEDQWIPKIVFKYNSEGKSTGRSQKKWIEQF